MVFISFTALWRRGKKIKWMRRLGYVDDAHAPLRVRKEHYLEATHPFADGVTPSKLSGPSA